MSHVSPTNPQCCSPSYFNTHLEDVNLNKSPANPINAEPRINNIQPQHDPSNNQFIGSFYVEKFSPVNYVNTTEEAKQPFISQASYNCTVNQILQYTTQDKAIELTQALIDKSDNLDAFKLNREKYIGIYGLYEETSEHLVSVTSEAYDKLKDDKKSFVSFANYFLAMHTLVEERCIPKENAVPLMQSIIKSSTNLEDFDSNFTKTVSTITKTQTKHFMDVCKELDSKKIFIDSNIIKEKIKQLCQNTSLPFHIVCDKLIEFAKKSNYANDFNMLVDVFLKETTLAEYTMISAEDLANSPDISFSTMHNFTQTCWFNSVCKYMLPVVKENNDIVQLLKAAIIKCNTKTTEDMYAKFVLQSLQAIFIALKNNSPVNIQISNFFKSIAMYNQKVTEEAINTTQDKAIKSIFMLIGNAFKDTKNPNYSEIISHDAEEFYIILSDLIGINSASNTIYVENTTEYQVNIIDLLLYGIVLNQELIFSVTREHKDELTIYQATDDTPEQVSMSIKGLNDILSRAKGISEDNLGDITQQLSFCEQQTGSIETESRQSEKLFADIDQLNQLVVRPSIYKKENNQYTIDTDQIMAVINSFFPEFTIPITDEKTKELYEVKFKPTSILMRQGDKATGHYFAISVRSSDNKLFIHNDNINLALENAFHYSLEDHESADFKSLSPKDQLLAYIKQKDVYPTNIRFTVASKDKR